MAGRAGCNKFLLPYDTGTQRRQRNNILGYIKQILWYLELGASIPGWHPKLKIHAVFQSSSSVQFVICQIPYMQE